MLRLQCERGPTLWGIGLRCSLSLLIIYNELRGIIHNIQSAITNTSIIIDCRLSCLIYQKLIDNMCLY